MLEVSVAKQAFTKLHHNEYVQVPADKAAGNVAMICRRFYTLTLSWAEKLETIRTASTTLLIIFKKTYLLLSAPKISVIISTFL